MPNIIEKGYFGIFTLETNCISGFSHRKTVAHFQIAFISIKIDNSYKVSLN